MPGVRRARALLTSLWLVLQTALVISPSMALLAAAHDETAAECTCTHGEHAICPMHHRAAPGSKICLIGSADDTSATLGSLFQAAGLMPHVTPVPAPEVIPAASIEPTAAMTFRSVPPDPPPPRA
jgi:hypothetical protein